MCQKSLTHGPAATTTCSHAIVALIGLDAR